MPTLIDHSQRRQYADGDPPSAERGSARCLPRAVLVAGQLTGGVAPGRGGAPQEVGKQFELGLGVPRTDPVQPRAHPRVEPEQLRVAPTHGPNSHRPPIDRRRITLPGDPPATRQPIENPGDRGGMQPSPPGQAGGADRTVQGDQLKAVQINVLEINMHANLMVEQRELVTQRPQRRLHRHRDPPPTPSSTRAGRRYEFHILLISSYLYPGVTVFGGPPTRPVLRDGPPVGAGGPS